MQLAGATIGLVLILAGIREINTPNSANWNRILLLLYVCGIVFMGLGAEAFKVDPTQPILGTNAFSLRDFLINLFGFLPLGYLITSNIAMRQSADSNYSLVKLILYALSLGIGISLTIETIQHLLIPGRFSSLYDIIGNGLGTLLGITVFFLGKKWNIYFDKSQRSPQKNGANSASDR